MMSGSSSSQDSPISSIPLPPGLDDLSPRERQSKARQWWNDNQLAVLRKISDIHKAGHTLPAGITIQTPTENWDSDLYTGNLPTILEEPQAEEHADNQISTHLFHSIDSDNDSIVISDGEDNMPDGKGASGTTTPTGNQQTVDGQQQDSITQQTFDPKPRVPEQPFQDYSRERRSYDLRDIDLPVDPIQPYRDLVSNLDHSMQKRDVKFCTCMDKSTDSFRKANVREQDKVDKERFKQGLKNINRSDGILSIEVERTLDDIDLALKQFKDPTDKAKASKYFITHATSGDLLRQVLKFLDDPKINTDYTWPTLRESIFKAFIANDVFEEQFRKLENMQIIPGETIPAFTRRFLFQVDKTYSEEPRSEELDKYLFKLFLKALKN